MKTGEFVVVCFSDGPVTFWSGVAWVTDRRAALRLSSDTKAIALWRERLASESTRDVWLVKDWGHDSERTIATREYGLIGGI